MRKEKKAVQIGFTKIALGKFIGQNDDVIYFTKKDVRRVVLTFKFNSSGSCGCTAKLAPRLTHLNSNKIISSESCLASIVLLYL